MAVQTASPAAGQKAQLTGWVYEADGHDREIDLGLDGMPRLRRNSLLWIDLEAGDDAGLEAAAELLELPGELVTRLSSEETRPSLADYEKLIHVRVVEVSKGEDPAALPMDAVAGKNWLLTRHGRDGGYSESFRDAFRGETELGRLDSLSFLAALLEHLLGHYFAAIEAVEQQIEMFDERTMQAAFSDGEQELARIVVLRRTLATLRRSLVLHRETYAKLGDPHLTSLANEHSANRARDLLARLERAVDAAESARQMVTGSFEILMTRSSQRTNDTMKLLTLISAALLPSAVLAGVLGMNFKQPFFDLSYLFWVVVALMAALVVAVGLFARWRNWL
jgi:magnesium transporter